MLEEGIAKFSKLYLIQQCKRGTCIALSQGKFWSAHNCEHSEQPVLCVVNRVTYDVNKYKQYEAEVAFWPYHLFRRQFSMNPSCVRYLGLILPCLLDAIFFSVFFCQILAFFGIFIVMLPTSGQYWHAIHTRYSS